MDLSGFLSDLTGYAVKIDAGRKGLMIDGSEGEGRVNYVNRVVRKLQFPNNFLLKTHFCRALARKNARLVREPMGFPHKSIYFAGGWN